MQLTAVRERVVEHVCNWICVYEPLKSAENPFCLSHCLMM